jgi:hypothetical protein
VATRADLQPWVVEALRAEGGSARVVDVCRRIWDRHERELRDSGDLFFTWQYDVPWAAYVLRRQGVLAAAADSPQGVWQLADRGS